MFMQEMELEDVPYSLENEQQFWVGELRPLFSCLSLFKLLMCPFCVVRIREDIVREMRYTCSY